MDPNASPYRLPPVHRHSNVFTITQPFLEVHVELPSTTRKPSMRNSYLNFDEKYPLDYHLITKR